jgi:hypothetical protein
MIFEKYSFLRGTALNHKCQIVNNNHDQQR